MWLLPHCHHPLPRGELAGTNFTFNCHSELVEHRRSRALLHSLLTRLTEGGVSSQIVFRVSAVPGQGTRWYRKVGFETICTISSHHLGLGLG